MTGSSSQDSPTNERLNQRNVIVQGNTNGETNVTDKESEISIEPTEATMTALEMSDENIKLNEIMVILTSKEGKDFKLPFSEARVSNVLLGLSQQNFDADDTLLNGAQSENDPFIVKMKTPTISSKTLSKLIEFCNQYSKDAMKPIQLPLSTSKIENIVQEWYADYLQNLEWELLLQLVAAANFLDIKPMLHLCCLGVVSRIVGKSADEVRPMFGLSNPVNGLWGEEQREEILRENDWANSAREEFIAEVQAKKDSDYLE